MSSTGSHTSRTRARQCQCATWRDETHISISGQCKAMREKRMCDSAEPVSDHYPDSSDQCDDFRLWSVSLTAGTSHLRAVPSYRAVLCTHRNARSEDGRHAQRLPYRALSSLYFSSLGLYTTMPILRAEPTIPRAIVRNEMCSLFIFLRSCHFTCDTQRRPLCRHASTKQDGDKRTTAQIAAQRL